jgi:DNA-binding MarR family transcriptional regulator
MRKNVDNVNQMPAMPADEVFESIHDIMHLYRSRQYRALREEPYELTHMENKVLGFFAQHPGATQSDLAAHSGRDKAQLTRLIRGLRDKGLLEARVDEEDRRSTRLQLTAEGRAIHRKLHAQGARLAGIAVTGMSEEECRLLVTLLERVRSNLEAE